MTHSRVSSDDATAPGGALALSSAAGRWTVAASVIGSGAVFLESTIVTVALPAIGREFAVGIAGLQWVLDGYLLTLGALMLLGGSLGDVLDRRRVFAWGAVAFAFLSGLCAVVPAFSGFIVLRLLQGAAGALLVPNSLALLEESFTGEERGMAIGKWAGWSAISTAAGPLLGGWVVDELSWRWLFAFITPVSLAAAWIALRRVPAIERVAERGSRAAYDRPHHGSDSMRGDASARIDWLGAALATAGLGAIVWALIEGPERGLADPATLVAGFGGLAFLVVFAVTEKRSSNPLLPIGIFRSRQFTGANIVTLLVYAALGAVFFLLILQLQNVLGYSALEAGASILPVNVLMLALSSRAGRLSARIGPRFPMAGGAIVAGIGMLLMARVQPGAGYVETVLPALVVFGLGLAALVAPLTAAVLGAVDSSEAGVASAVNNAVARLAGLLAVAILPIVAGISTAERASGEQFAAGFARAMWIGAALCFAGAVVALFTVARGQPTIAAPHPSPTHACVGGRHQPTAPA
ncbi:MAG TPA: MFS transporter [Gemmatimonadaceae bacterium]|jgi:MFS family permease|nr:MFS transporter [Gemmatimonadaceae bacterium]